MAGQANWDMSTYFTAFGGKEYKAHWQTLRDNLEAFSARAGDLGRLTTENVADWAGLFLLNEDIVRDYSHLASYLVCLAAADVTDEAIKKDEAGLSVIGAGYAKGLALVMEGLRTAEDQAFALLLAEERMQGAEHYLKRLRQRVGMRMAPDLEILAADLGVDGMDAWGRLYDEMSGRLSFAMEGRPEPVPMAQKRMLMEDDDPGVRRAALAGSNKAWQDVEYVAGAGLNAIAGTRLTLYRHRGIADFLDEPLFDAAATRQTIDAMWAAVDKHKDVAWRYLRTKAELLGRDRLGFQDLHCGLPREAFAGKTEEEGGRYTWDQAVDLVLGAFGKSYPALAEFCRAMLENNRVESEKRAGKRPGAFCTTTLKTRESRVFMTFGGGLGDVQTLAHELGHAYHGFTLREMRPMAARYPMTLAETASTFAERLLQDAILADPGSGDAVRLKVLTARLNDAATFLCDIRMRYLFERRFYTERGQGEVSVSRLKELMLEAQAECYGDTLDPDELDPMFWASKLHFYITGVSFYNFPYTFGYLLSMGLAASVREQGQAFIPRYEEFLKLTGSRWCEQAVSEALGRDLGGAEFWENALALVGQDLDAFLSLLPG